MKLGIAFSGGGVKASAHLGIAKALQENNINPEIFAGTSAGAIVASLLAQDVKPDVALKILESVSSNIVDIDYVGIISNAVKFKLITGIAKGEALEQDLDKFFKGFAITNINKPLAIIATDIKTGKQIIFNNYPQGNYSLICDDNFSALCDLKTPLSYLISASCSLPVVYEPKPYGQYSLVDGGLVNNLPADAVKAIGADRIISIDLGLSGAVEDTNDIVHIATQTISVFMERAHDNARKDFDILLNPQVQDVHVLDTSRIQECYDRGYKYAIDNMDKIKEQLGGNQNV